MQASEFLTLADLLPEGMLLVAADGEVLAINRVACRKLGQTSSQIVGQNLSGLTGLSAEVLQAKIRPCTRSRNPIPLAIKCEHAGQSAEIHSCEGFLATPAEGDSRAQIIIKMSDAAVHNSTFHTLNQEVAKQRRVLRQLEESREQLRINEENLAITLNSIGDAVMVTDEKGVLVSLNPVAEQLTGWSNEEARGKPVKKVFPIIDASTRDTIENPVEKVLSTGETVYLSNHTTLISKDGTEYQIADSAAPIREKLGSDILGMVLVFHDVTEQYRLRAENQQNLVKLRRNEKLYRQLVETTRAVAWEYDLIAQRFVYVGPNILELTGYPQQSWTGFDSWADRIHPEDREHVVEFCAEETRNGRDHTIEYRNITASEQVIWIRDEVSVIMRDNEPVTMRGYFFDITEAKQAEEALRRSQKMDAVGQMAGGIAHDFNNILNVILGHAQLLELQVSEDEKAMQRLAVIRRSGERAAKLTRQLLGFSSREALSVRLASVNEVITGMDSLISQSLTPQVEVQYNLDDALWKANIDTGDLEDAVLNLILNARDAMEGRGKLSIETENSVLDEYYCKLNPDVVPGDYVQLAVSDNGSGISPETQKHIFEPFYTTKEQGKGTGLGLSMVFGFVNRCHGHIKVYSELDIGTTFRLYLPREKTEQDAEASAQSNNAELLDGKETILVVDDEPALLELAEEILLGLGYSVLTASNAEEALQQLQQSPGVDLLFSDVVMPGGMNGYELAEQAVARNPELKVLLTSGYTDMAVARNGQARFKENLMSKPYTLADLAIQMRRCLER